MFSLRLLPWEYGVRNLMRRPTRTVLTLAALTIVTLLVFVVVGFIRGLEQSLSVSGDPAVVIVYSIGADESVENSAIAARTAGLLTASLEGIQKRYGVVHASPELYLGTRVSVGGSDESLGLVRGVTDATPLVRRRVRLIEGRWPGRGEVMVGKLVAAKLGLKAGELAIGSSVTFDRHTWRISGQFSAGGSALESEIWGGLNDLQQALNRQDLSLVALLMSDAAQAPEVDLFCKQRTDLELQSLTETAYYRKLQTHYAPVRALAWLVVALVAGAGVFAGLNMMYGAVAGRTREIAMLQAVGYRRRAVLASLIQEAVLLACAASLLAGAIALVFFNGIAIRFTMGAFALRLDSVAVLVGCATGVLLGVVGALPPAWKALSAEVAESLKAI